MRRPTSSKALVDRPIAVSDALPINPEPEEVEAVRTTTAATRLSHSPETTAHIAGTCQDEACERCLRQEFCERELTDGEIKFHAYDGLVEIYTPTIFPDKISIPKLEPQSGMKDVFRKLEEDLTAEQRLVVCYTALYFKVQRQIKSLHAFAYGVRVSSDETAVVSRYSEVAGETISTSKEFLDRIFADIESEFRARVETSHYSMQVFDKYRSLRWSTDSGLDKDVVLFLTATTLHTEHCQQLLKLWVMYDGTSHIVSCQTKLNTMLEKRDRNPDVAFPLILVLYCGLQAYDSIEDSTLTGHQWPKIAELRETFVRSVIFFLSDVDFPEPRRRLVGLFRHHWVSHPRRIKISPVSQPSSETELSPPTAPP